MVGDGVEALARVQIRVRCGARLRDEIAERLVIVGVEDRAGGIGQGAGAAINFVDDAIVGREFVPASVNE